MFTYYLIFSFVFIIRNSRASQLEIDIPSISSSYTFELSSNSSHTASRNVLMGLVDGASSSIPSSIFARASYEQIRIERFFNLYESKNKQSSQPIKKEPVFRSYLLTPSFNRSFPFIRVLIASAYGSYEDLNLQPICATVTAVNELNLYETEACFISPKTGYCLVSVSALKMVEYAHQNQTTNKIELYFKLHHVVSSTDCMPDNTAKQDHTHHETRIGHAEYVDNDNMLISTMTGSSISIDYPIGIHYPGWYFPLKLKLMLSSSVLSSFIVRCRLKSYFSIATIQTTIPKISNYQIHINAHTYARPQSISDIDFNVTIDSNSSISQDNLFEIDLATIMLIIDPTNSSKSDTNSFVFIDWFLLSNSSSTSNKSILRVPIRVQYDDVQTIVALTDYTSLINTAMLSMQIQQFPLKILSVNHSGSIQSISQAVCHSENMHLIQVDSSCNHVYFSGHERDDFFDHTNSPTSIVIRYEKYLQRLYFTIYIPERPLRIELSDAKLSRINGWFVTKREDHKQKNEAVDDDIDDDDEDDQNDDDDDDDDDDDVKCYQVYQQALIHVYTKFYRTTQNGDRIYLFNKQNVLVTSFVRPHLETDNGRVAIVKNGRVIGVGPGKTNVRIYSSTNNLPMGSKTIQVDDQEIIRIQNISFNLLTNLNLQTNSIEHIDPIYKIHFEIKPIFNQLDVDNKTHFGQMHIMLTYSDNTSISLDELPADYYQLEFDITRTNPSLMRFDPSISWKNWRFYPLSFGQTSISARLKLGQQRCTDDRNFSQNDLSCEIVILSTKNHQPNKNIYSSSHPQSEHHIIWNNHPDQQGKTSPFLIALSVLLGACIVLFLAFVLHWLFHFYYRKKGHHAGKRDRQSTHSGAEEANQDWIFLDRNSLEMPLKQQNSLSVHNSTLHITPNPVINSSTLQRQKELSELSHSQMIAYFDNLKESHA